MGLLCLASRAQSIFSDHTSATVDMGFRVPEVIRNRFRDPTGQA